MVQKLQKPLHTVLFMQKGFGPHFSNPAHGLNPLNRVNISDKKHKETCIICLPSLMGIATLCSKTHNKTKIQKIQPRKWADSTFFFLRHFAPNPSRNRQTFKTNHKGNPVFNQNPNQDHYNFKTAQKGKASLIDIPQRSVLQNPQHCFKKIEKCIPRKEGSHTLFPPLPKPSPRRETDLQFESQHTSSLPLVVGTGSTLSLPQERFFISKASIPCHHLLLHDRSLVRKPTYLIITSCGRQAIFIYLQLLYIYIYIFYL